MLAPHPDRMSAEEFLRWIELQDDRHELIDGVPVKMMAGAKQSHNVAVGNIADALRVHAKARGCRTTSSDTAVVTATGTVRYPDIVVDCGPADPDAMAAVLPTILVEVLSPSTSQIDFSDKLDEYRNIQAIEIILLVDPDTVLVKAYRRNSDRNWTAERYDALEQSVALDPIGTAIALRDIYDTLSPKIRPRIEIVRPYDPDI